LTVLFVVACEHDEGRREGDSDACHAGERKCVGGNVHACDDQGEMTLEQTCVGGTECFHGECVYPDVAAPDITPESDSAPPPDETLEPPPCSPEACAADIGAAPQCYVWACSDGCKLVPAANGTACNDSSDCTTGDVCQEGLCLGSPAACDDGLDCTVDGCDPGSGCTHLPVNALCDDTNPCTLDECSTAAGCQHAAYVGQACSDADPCTVGESCEADGTCGNGQALECSDDNECTDDSCDPGSGECVFAPDDTNPCDDGDPKTQTECVSGECLVAD
jgi:hypothetical protein